MSRSSRTPGITRRVAGGLGLALLAAPGLAASPLTPQWGIVEVALEGPRGPEAFDLEAWAVFEQGAMRRRVRGFYDGEGVYRFRFSPPSQGRWRWRTQSPVRALNARAGTVEVSAPRTGDHGPVSVAGQYHFAHADGTPYRQIGTTAYSWAQQGDEACQATLKSLAASPFNKMRMCVLPHMEVEPISPFAQAADGGADLDRFNPAYFRRYEQRIAALGLLGIQADLILFHPYAEASAFHRMNDTQDDRYVRYVVARFSAYANVWWSLANEWDLVKERSRADFGRIGRLIAAEDAHGRLRSIHNWRELYDHGEAWVTHASIQNGSAVMDDARAEIFRSVWRKPVIFDEVRYEGDISKRWGDLSGQALVERFWHGTVAGTYVGHGEALGERGWISRGRSLKGKSPPRLGFLKSILESGPTPGIEPIDKWWEQHLGGQLGRYYLRYFGSAAPADWAFALPKDRLVGGERFKLDVIDTWNMTITPLEGVFEMKPRDAYFFHDPGRPSIALPGRPYIAVRAVRLDA